MVFGNPHSGYSYAAGIEKLLSDYAAKEGEVTFIIIVIMEKKLVVKNLLKRASHTVVMYLENTLIYLLEMYFI